MQKNSYSGKFIVLEGLDGSGQSTQTKILTNFLKKKGYRVLKTKEPTSQSQAGKIIRKFLDKKEKTSARKLQELFAQDRKWHLKNLIIPALKKGKIVISDRYFFSSFSYGKAEGLALEKLIKLNEKFLLPDLVFFLDVRPKVCLERIKRRAREKTLFERKEKLEKVYSNFKKNLKKFKNIYIINGNKSIKEVSKDIKDITDKKLKNYENF